MKSCPHCGGQRTYELSGAVSVAVRRHGGVRATERATGVDAGYISRMMRGQKNNPSDETLAALGIGTTKRYMVN